MSITSAIRRITVPMSVCSVLMAGTLSALPALADDDSARAQVTVAQGAEAGEHAGPGHHHEWHHGGMLTDDQLSKIADLREATREKTATQREQLHRLGYQLHKLMLAPTVDKGQALAIQTQMNALKGELANARLASHIDVLSILTPEQREGMRHRMLMRGAMGGHGHGHGPGGRGGHMCHGGPGGGGFKGHGPHGGHMGAAPSAPGGEGPVVLMPSAVPPVALQIDGVGPSDAMDEAADD